MQSPGLVRWERDPLEGRVGWMKVTANGLRLLRSGCDRLSGVALVHVSAVPDHSDASTGYEELFGERTVDDVTVKDSRVENDQPKTANNFWTIGGDLRICSSAPAISAFPTSEESPQK
ncbi:hypothetical protein BLNAU_21626 [Blattamonas nauphoetae]|uniref:Uncharacterized protein n=1 Tax=Blattamonas nauphoetae TaxID=2049346 RepID=A0ABQ9WVU0_9EUKA|nr:hypothetical protein BLNAU_21626 [Blattamonas nauphoetae]